MERRYSRILTTHAGALPRPDALLALNAQLADCSDSNLIDTHRTQLRAAVREVVERQIALGIDVVNDGEYGKAMRTRLDYGAWVSYVIERFTGFEESGEIASAKVAARPDAVVKPGGFLTRRDRQAFPDVYADIDREMFAGGPRPMSRPIVGPVA